MEKIITSFYCCSIRNRVFVIAGFNDAAIVTGKGYNFWFVSKAQAVSRMNNLNLRVKRGQFYKKLE